MRGPARSSVSVPRAVLAPPAAALRWRGACAAAWRGAPSVTVSLQPIGPAWRVPGSSSIFAARLARRLVSGGRPTCAAKRKGGAAILPDEPDKEDEHAAGGESGDADGVDDDLEDIDEDLGDFGDLDLDDLDDLGPEPEPSPEADALTALAESDESPGLHAGGAPWAAAAFDAATAALAAPALGNTLAIYSVSCLAKFGSVLVKLDKPSNKYGSPSLDDISKYSRALRDELEAAAARGVVPADLATEASSPGAERPLRVPAELSRFQGLPITVRYRHPDDGPEATEILELVSLDDAAGVWRPADVRANRPPGKGRAMPKRERERRIELPHAAVLEARLHLDI